MLVLGMISPWMVWVCLKTLPPDPMQNWGGQNAKTKWCLGILI
jgi:hypothetical protein